MPKLIIDGRAFKDAAIFSSNEETRFYLKGVCIEPSPNPGMVLAIATDGHRMAIIEAIGQVDDSRPIISLACLAAVKKAKQPWLVVDDAGTVTVLDLFPVEIKSAADIPADFGTMQRQQFPLGLIDGTFPDWRRILPAELTGGTVQNANYNSAYIADYAKVSLPDSCKRGKGQAVRIVANDAGMRDGKPILGPAWVFLPSRPDFVGIIMPVNGDTPAMPDFLRPIEPQPSAIAAE